jgi:hypothetical protein
MDRQLCSRRPGRETFASRFLKHGTEIFCTGIVALLLLVVSGSSTFAQTTPIVTMGPGGVRDPEGVAVDAAGDIFIADTANNRVVKVPADGDALSTIGCGLKGPEGVAVDEAGDVFIADTYNNRVLKVPVDGGAQMTVRTGLNQPHSVAGDRTGDVFIADTRNNRVAKVLPGGAQSIVSVTGQGTPFGVAVDEAGDPSLR